jgi:hypothetical protein
MTPSGNDWAAYSLEPGAELIVGWRPEPDHLDAATVVLAGRMATSLEGMAAAALVRLASLTRRDYAGSPYVEPGEEYLAVPTASLRLPGQTGAPTASPGPDESELLSELHRLVKGTLTTSLSKNDLREGHYLFYAVVCAIKPSHERIGFVRQVDPHKAAKVGGALGLLGDQGLHEVTDPLFIFDGDFDLIVAPDETAVLRLEAFNRLFADLGLLTQAAPANATLVCQSVGKVSPAAVTALGVAAAARRSFARRLQRLAAPGALPTPITPTSLKSAMRRHGLDPALIVSGNIIDFGVPDAGRFLDLLEQIYYETDFTREHRRADRYSPLK